MLSKGARGPSSHHTPDVTSRGASQTGGGGPPPPPPPPGPPPRATAAGARSPRSGGGARDTAVMSSRLTSTTFVGRTGELQDLRRVLAEAAAGRPALAFVAGESGVGKTRLLAELERAAKADG